MLKEHEKKAISEHYQILSNQLEGFRPRKAQREMLAAIARALGNSDEIENNTDTLENHGESIVVIEGPTGVGKSIAYLLSGCIMAQSRQKKLLVSSATVALQEQLIFRDLPFLAEKSGLQMTYALAKGRGRYLCPYRLYQITQNGVQPDLPGFYDQSLSKSPLNAEERRLLKDLADAFHKRQWNGDRDAWSEIIPDHLWQNVRNDRHGCLKNTCPHQAECPFALARQTLNQVDIIVANHDLLLSDIAMGGGAVLPESKNCFYCIDEAHHLAKKAVSHFSAAHSLQEARSMMNRFPQHTTRMSLVLSNQEQIQYCNPAEDAAMELQKYWLDWEAYLNACTYFEDEQNTESVWLWEPGIIPSDLEDLVQNTHKATQTMLGTMQNLDAVLNAKRKEIAQDGDTQVIDNILLTWGMILSRFEQIADTWALLQEVYQDTSSPPLAKWIVLKRDDGIDYVFQAAPVSASTLLSQQLWKKSAGAVLTSATLRANGNFHLLLKQTGLNFLSQTQTVALQSPFDFANRAELYIPPLTASPKEVDKHTAQIAEWLPQLINIQDPTGTLVLFTSRKQMEEVVLMLPKKMRECVLVQGERSKSALLKTHQETVQSGSASILFGLDSFAEGLDLPGALCIQVIIAKLPFSVPDDPIDSTLRHWVEKSGGNSFMEISVPEATIKLTQAVGRLIRTETDYGRVTILDNRLLSARYAPMILQSLPPFRRI